ncbi:right-handed parallel beta-helix repeat-containing protein [Arthrobacter sp. B2a2-09]|uniref:right-handed parallel beta-helix repeat-containing protein n=1 Tax=Arthrobacter sp. B2a2-09 TaxID=2952822 RepID=UPI0022CD7937|nr:right-handed parallel beta-helix repeat-containing protein [Arthrobacter sp. B2a2-09]MCZ9882324.1 right-handed parallel beta-helix repeat-containing protein [Arthrobacter sp. B2a2-09]
MYNESEERGAPLGGGASVKRRGLFKLGALATAMTGAFAASSFEAGPAHAAADLAPTGPSASDLSTTYVTQTSLAASLTRMVAKDELIVNVKDHGAVGDAVRNPSGGSISSGSSTFFGGGFAASDVGKFFAVVGAGPNGTTLVTVIAAYVNAGTITLGSPASTTVANAPYLYGTDDTGAIQKVLDGVNDDSYTQVFFPKGSYLTGGLLLKNNTQLLGAGRGAWAYEFYQRTTRLIAKPDMTTPGLINDSADGPVGNVRVADMMLDGARAFQASAHSGIYMADSKISADSFWSIERVYVGFFSGDGAYFGAFRRANRVNECHFWRCAGNGVRLDGTDNSFVQTVFAQNGADGILLNQGANHFFGCDIFSNVGNGARIVPFGRMNQFTNCFFDTNYKCGVYNEAKNLSLTQCRFTSNSQSADGLYPDIDIVGGPPGCSLVNPTFYAGAGLTNLPHSGIRAAGNGVSNLVYVTGFSHDPGVTTWRSGSYVEVSVGMLHKGFAFSDGSVLTTGSSSGTKLGANATNKLAFFGAIPIVRPTIGAAASDAATTQALVNDLRTKLIALGLIG